MELLQFYLLLRIFRVKDNREYITPNKFSKSLLKFNFLIHVSGHYFFFSFQIVCVFSGVDLINWWIFRQKCLIRWFKLRSIFLHGHYQLIQDCLGNITWILKNEESLPGIVTTLIWKVIIQHCASLFMSKLWLIIQKR